MSTEEETFLGFDLSTQKLKAAILNSTLQPICTAEVQFDSDLPEYRTTGGANAGAGRNEYFVQPTMWVKALDMVLDRLVMAGADFSKIQAISGSAQQHGSLYWSKHGVETLRKLDSDKFLHIQIDESSFTLTRTPIWMDGSTQKQCIEMEEAIGGKEEMVGITGSKCYPRFTGPQIRKIYQNRTHCYEDTQKISLVSSFLASIFLNNIASIDFSDGSGMNLFDIHERKWSKPCLNACAPDLDERLGEAVKTCSILGNIGKFFVDRYGFKEDCKVCAFTGDNPSALTGLLEPTKLQEGHVFCHPTEEGAYMGLLCFRNGSLVRDFLRKTEAKNDWETFNQLLESTPRGNYGNMALHFQVQEIIPNVNGTLKWNKSNTLECSKGLVKYSSPEAEVRALVEGQMLHKKAVAIDFGFHFEQDTKIVATGGASVNKSILQVISDVFNAPVYVQTESEAALFGAAYRAKYCVYKSENSEAMSYYDYIVQYIPDHLKLVCEPSKDSDSIYTPMLKRYREMVESLKNKKD
uniref:Xylulose kinase n=1 Tax=Megaselia scalaris TaxID=36166 RepID=T1GE88_MEGSC